MEYFREKELSEMAVGDAIV